MAKTPIPSEVRRFILTSLPSVPHLEALLLLRATAPTAWTATELAQRLYVPAGRARDVMAYLSDAGMCSADEYASAYAYAPQSRELGGIIDAVALFYSSNLVDITLLIHSKSDPRAQQFADAFRFRKDA